MLGPVLAYTSPNRANQRWCNSSQSLCYREAPTAIRELVLQPGQFSCFLITFLMRQFYLHDVAPLSCGR
jgi:hypothetical protein